MHYNDAIEVQETPVPRNWKGPSEKGSVLSKQDGRLSYNPYKDDQPPADRCNPTNL